MNDGLFTDTPDLYKRIAAGDESAFRQLFGIYAPRLQALAARITGSMAVADDLVFLPGRELRPPPDGPRQSDGCRWI